MLTPAAMIHTVVQSSSSLFFRTKMKEVDFAMLQRNVMSTYVYPDISKAVRRHLPAFAVHSAVDVGRGYFFTSEREANIVPKFIQ